MMMTGNSKPMRTLLPVFCLFSASCAGSMDKIADMREAAPDWYEARKVELAGEGYPSLSSIPVDDTYKAQSSGLRKTGAESAAILAAFEASPKAEPAYLTPAEIRDWGMRIRASVGKLDQPADFLTDSDIAALKARFDRPRARR